LVGKQVYYVTFTNEFHSSESVYPRFLIDAKPVCVWTLKTVFDIEEFMIFFENINKRIPAAENNKTDIIGHFEKQEFMLHKPFF
jgi:hypothetical protein